MAKRGLPERSVMRHDSHYVEELTKRSGRHIGTMLPLAFVGSLVLTGAVSTAKIRDLEISWVVATSGERRVSTASRVFAGLVTEQARDEYTFARPEVARVTHALVVENLRDVVLRIAALR